MTSHDREFMNRIVSEIAEIDAGEITTYTGNYDFYDSERTKSARPIARRHTRDSRQCSPKSSDSSIASQTHAAKAAQVQSRVKALDKIEKIELPKKRRIVKFGFRRCCGRASRWRRSTI